MIVQQKESGVGPQDRAIQAGDLGIGSPLQHCLIFGTQGRLVAIKGADMIFRTGGVAHHFRRAVVAEVVINLVARGDYRVRLETEGAAQEA
ncbi:MAG: hypothetical protein MUE80_04280, partial [Acidobacteria bacterium]|nr:hypothetical protein [Acidobacteriota bacterium]